MRLLQVEVANFMLYDHAEVKPGELTLVTGANGAGKSCLVEAVAWALYGETIRGSSPVPGGDDDASRAEAVMRQDVPCQALVTFEHAGKGYAVRRKRGAKGTALSLTIVDPRTGFKPPEGNQSGQTPTETQRKIDALLGPFSQFVATRVFSQEHVARFGAATDKGRKQLLETSSPELSRFDRASTLCRKELAAARKALAAAEMKEARADGELSSLTRQLAALPAEATLPSVEQLVDLRARADEAQARYDQLAAAAQAAREQVATATAILLEMKNRRADLANRQAESLRRAQRAADLTDCPVCLRQLGQHDHAAIAQHYQAEAAALAPALADADATFRQTEADRRDLGAEEASITAQAKEARADLDARRAVLARADAARQAGAGREVDRLRLADAADEARRAHQDAIGGAQAARARVTRLEAADDALGLRGARTLMLGRLLARLQGAAGRVLGHLGSPLRVEISGTTTTAGGKEVDAVSVRINGAGGGEYRGASRGQRALVDLALLLGLAEVAGAGDGLVCFDEVFDSLDDEKVERVADYLRDLVRQGRQVLVVSHHTHLHGRFPGASHVRVELEGGRSVARG